MTDPDPKPDNTEKRPAGVRVADPKYRNAMRRAAELPNATIDTIGREDVLAVLDLVDELETAVAEIQRQLQL